MVQDTPRDAGRRRIPRMPISMVTVSLLATLVSGGVGDTQRDSVATHRAAKRAQAEFEQRRHRLLPEVAGSSGRCDARVGRFCYWVDDANTKPPAEPTRVATLRDQLLARLASTASANPGDGWIAGQRVRYLIEAKRYADAIDIARDCRAESSWCTSLAALALHAADDLRGADSAVSAALAAMPESDRCAALDIETLVDGALRSRLRDASCAQRDSLAARWWWLSRPYYSRAGDPLRSELFARRTLAMLASSSRSAYGTSAGRDLRDLILRYGWPIAWGRTPARSGTMTETGGAVGFDASPSFAFGADAAAVEDPTTVGDHSYALTSRSAPARFAVRGVSAIGTVGRRIALFRRGDSTLVVAAFEAGGDTALARAREPIPALVLLRDEHTAPVIARGASATRGVLSAIAPWRPRVVAVELVDSASGRGARGRDGIEAASDSATRVSLSDLLLFAADGGHAVTLDDVMSRAIAGVRVDSGTRLGLFWEMYGLQPGERVTASVGIVPHEPGWLRRVAERANLAEPREPRRLQWSDTPSISGSVGGRTLVLDLTGIPEGRYRIELALSLEGQADVRAASDVEIVNP
jgi:hypothetical protein